MTWRTEWWKSLPQKEWKKTEDNLRDLWYIKHTNMRIIGIPEEEREKGPEKTFEEIIAENFPNMGKKIVNQVQEAQSPKKDKPKEKHKIHSNQYWQIRR